MRTLFLALTLITASSCKEFYDEEFEEAALTQQNENENRSYEATLVSTDGILTNLTGTVSIDVRDDVVNTQIQLDDIPQNMVQVYYTYSSADCTSLATTIPANQDSIRNYSSNETLTKDALVQELIAAGASSAPDDSNLEGTSLLIRAAPIANGLPSPSGTNVITIACGQLTLSQDQNDTDGTTTGTTTGGVTGTTTGGDIGGDIGGDFGTVTGGDFGGAAGGDISGSVGGDTSGDSF